MSKEKMKNALEKQFEFLSNFSRECEPEYLESITRAMLNIYTILYPYQDFQG